MNIRSYLLISAFTLILFCAVYLTFPFQNKVLVQNSVDNTKDIINYEDKKTEPHLVGQELPPDISAQSYLVADAESGMFLLDKDSHQKLYPASTVKIITALVAMDYYDNEDILTVNAISVEGQKMKLSENEKIKVGSLLYGLLVFSANDAAEVLAQNYEGGRENFTAAMNLKANEIGLKETNFDNPTGLDSTNQHTTSYDLIKTAKYALKNPLFAEIVSTKKAYVKSADGKIVHNLQNLNKLLSSVEGVLGVKTGWTEFAKENLVTYVERNGNRILIALMGSEDRFADTEKLIEWIYDNYSWES